jgi:hypothetical protein
MFCLPCCLTYCSMVSYMRSVGTVWGSEESAACVPPARGYADDLGLVVSSEQGTNKLLQVIASFCGWSGMRVNLREIFITAYDFYRHQPLSTDNIRYQGFPLCHLPARESFPCLGVSAALVGGRGRQRL